MAWIIQHLLAVTLLMLLFAVGSVLGLFRFLPERYFQRSRPRFAALAASGVVAVLFSVILTNWYGLKRDRDDRLIALRDQHYRQLRPVLRQEALNLQEIAGLISTEAHIAQMTKGRAGADPSRLLWPEEMSHDLVHHFSDYERSKQDLLIQITIQDQEFHSALDVAERQRTPPIELAPDWRETVSMAFIESCVGHGNGIGLIVSKEGFIFSSWDVSTRGKGAPSPDQAAAFQRFKLLHIDPTLRFQCDSLKSRAQVIQQRAEELAQEALRLSDGWVLNGSCEFIKSEDGLD